MIEAGIPIEAAVDTAIWYMQQGDEDGLERYVMEVEARRERSDNGVCIVQP